MIFKFLCTLQVRRTHFISHFVFFNFAILKFPDRSFSNPTKTGIAIKCYDQMCTGIFFPFEDHNFLTYQRLPVYEKTSQVSCNTISRIGNEPLFSRYSNIGYRLNLYVIVCRDLPLLAIFDGIWCFNDIFHGKESPIITWDVNEKVFTLLEM